MNGKNDGRIQKGAPITHCKYGHEFTPENTYWRKDGGAAPRRACKRCTYLRGLERNQRNRKNPDAPRKGYSSRTRTAVTLDCGHVISFGKPYPVRGETITCCTCWSLAGTVKPPPSKVIT